MEENQINIKSQHLELSKTILKKYINEKTIVWIFGSRVLETFKPFSDLDIALQYSNNEPIPLKIVASIKADFVESDLPYKVDVIDYNSLSGKIKNNIDQNKIKLNFTN